MTERPILFSAPMIRALLAGIKRHTRRIVKPRPGIDGEWPCPYGNPGDRLWVRETWRTVESLDAVRPVVLAESVPIHFDADHTDRGKFREPIGRARPSIFMPRWASRITLTIEEVRVERLHDISEEDATREGVGLAYRQDGPGTFAKDSAIAAFKQVWTEINGAASWDANPWVWVVSFRKEST